jgi:DNA/RNA endonuclease G (NUC1)
MSTELEKAFAKETLLACEGYVPTFIDKTSNINIEKIIPAASRHLLPEVEGNKKGILNYTNLSVLYNSERRVPFVSAYNIDGSAKKTVKRTGFKPDPRIDLKIQLDQKGFYDLRKDITEFEIGHMAANNEMAWGKNAQFQSYQTFHFPNSAPQAENLNTGILKTLETYIIDEASNINNNKRISVFTGPLLRKNDPTYVKDPNFKIPLLFFKVIVFPTGNGLFSTGFMMSHEQRMLELGMFTSPPADHGMREIRTVSEPDFTDFKYKKVFQVNIKYLEEQTGLNFSWKGVKSIEVPNDKNQVKKIEKIKDATDAGNAEGALRGIRIPAIEPTDEDLTDREIKARSFKLNIILP